MSHGPGTYGRTPATYNPVCRSCGAPITWLRTKAGKQMPVDDPQRAIARHKAALVRLGEEIADRIVEASGAEKAASALQQWIEGLR